ncbi:MAG: FIST N-terminal domain-containing protein, partial [Candidatus Latescibacterota bacterium]
AALEVYDGIERAIGKGPIDLMFVFPSAHHAESAHKLLDRFSSVISPKVLVGCTGEGVIGTNHEVEGESAIAVVAARLPGVELHPFALLPREIHDLASNPRTAPESIKTGADTRAFIMLADPFSAHMDGLLKAFNTAFPGIPIIGGMASGARSPGESALFMNDHTYRQGVVGVALAGPITVDTIVSQGCRPVGPVFEVTDGDANVIKKLDDKPAMAQVQELIEELSEDDKMLLTNGLFVGRAIDSSREMYGRGDFLVRGVVGIDRKTGAIAIGDFVDKGESVQFHLRDADTAREDLEMMLTPHSLFGAPSGAVLFSCNGRGTRLYDHPNGDISAINSFFEDLPIAGFFCAGEIGPIGGQNFLHGHTASLALIRPVGDAATSNS